jgi:hypothetical protein
VRSSQLPVGWAATHSGRPFWGAARRGPGLPCDQHQQHDFTVLTRLAQAEKPLPGVGEKLRGIRVEFIALAEERAFLKPAPNLDLQ